MPPVFSEWAAQASNLPFLLQMAACAIGASVAWLLKILVNRRLALVLDQRSKKTAKPGMGISMASRIMPPLVGPLLFLIALKIATVVLQRFDITAPVLGGISQLAVVWIVVRFVGLIAGDTVMVRVIGYGLWGLAALDLAGILEPTATLLEGMQFSLGKIKVTALDVIKGIVALVVMVWLAGVVSDAAERQLQNQKQLRAASRALIVKLIRVVAYAIAVMAGMSVMGIDLTALAVFGGALGVGIGLGLQKVVANFVGGIVLLAEKSITPGDIIEYNGVQGKVKFLGVRFVCLDTFDGREQIIPNEELITKPVVNWTRVEPQVRGEFMLPLAHGQAFAHIRDVLLECCRATDSVLDDPAPLIFIKRLTHYAMEVDVKFWIADADTGLGSVRTELIALILQRFEESGIRLATLAVAEEPPPVIPAGKAA